MSLPGPSSSPAGVVVVEDHPPYRDALAHAIEHSPDLYLMAVCKDLPDAQRQVEAQCPDLLLVDLGLPNGSGLKLLRLASFCWPGRCTSALLTFTGIEENLMPAVEAGAKGYLLKSDAPAQWLLTLRRLLDGQSMLHAGQARDFLQRLSTAEQVPVLAGAALSPADGIGSDSTPPSSISPPRQAQGGAPLPTSMDGLTRQLLLDLAAGYTLAEAASRLDTDEADAGRRLRALYDRFFHPPPNLSPRELQLLRLLDKGLPFRQCAQIMGVGEATTKTQSQRAYQKLGAQNLQSALYEARQAGLLF